MGIRSTRDQHPGSFKLFHVDDLFLWGKQVTRFLYNDTCMQPCKNDLFIYKFDKNAGFFCAPRVLATRINYNFLAHSLLDFISRLEIDFQNLKRNINKFVRFFIITIFLHFPEPLSRSLTEALRWKKNVWNRGRRKVPTYQLLLI